MATMSPTTRTTLLAGCAILALTFAGCSTDKGVSAGTATTAKSATTSKAPTTAAATKGAVYPGTQWDKVDPAAAGLDAKVLDEMATTAQTAGSNCLLVTRKGKLVDEHYWNGTGPETAPQEVYSASKSFTSALVGMAHDDGKLDVTDKASKFIPQWVGTPSADVTVENLLSNDSGRHYDVVTDYGGMAAKADDKSAFAVGLGQDAPPGTVWKYNNSAIQTLEPVFRAATGKDLSEFAQQRLFAPLGMAHSSLIRDKAGNPLTFMGVQSTCRDMARFGYLMLRQGNWDGKQLLSKEWVADSTGRSSQKLNAAYGWLWWLNRTGPQQGDDQAMGDTSANPTTTAQKIDRMIPGAPEDMFFALGLGGQVIAVDPGSETVVVRLGPATYPDGTPKYKARDAAVLAGKGVTGG